MRSRFCLWNIRVQGQGEVEWGGGGSAVFSHTLPVVFICHIWQGGDISKHYTLVIAFIWRPTPTDETPFSSWHINGAWRFFPGGGSAAYLSWMQFLLAFPWFLLTSWQTDPLRENAPPDKKQRDKKERDKTQQTKMRCCFQRLQTREIYWKLHVSFHK